MPPPNCAVGGFSIDPDGTIWRCTGLDTPPVQVSFATSSHSHVISDVTGLQAELDALGGQGPGAEAFPVGSVFIAVVATNPGTLLGYGTWAAFAAGRVLVGIDAGQTEFDTVRETGGAKTHTLSTAEIPAHNHQILRERSATTGGATTQIARTGDTSSTVDTNVFTENAGGGGAHNNLQPYITVYMWERTA